MGGYSNSLFEPNNTLTRTQFAQILFNTEAVRWATSQGIVSGYGNRKFGPNDNITREQLAVMLWRYAGSPAAIDKELHFNDISEASRWSMEAMCWAVENGVLNGYGDGRLNPKGLATRA